MSRRGARENFQVQTARVVAARGDAADEMLAERRFYRVSRDTTTEAAIRPVGLTNIYISLGGPDGEGGWILRIYYHPLVLLIWFGPALMALWRYPVAGRPTDADRGAWVASNTGCNSRMRLLSPLLLLLFLALPAPVQAVNPDEVLDDPALETRARAMSRDLRCVVCRNQSIDDSNAGIARDMRIVLA